MPTISVMPDGFHFFNVSDPPPPCARWKDHMPKFRNPEVFKIYINARKLWRSKIEWEMNRSDLQKILQDVQMAASRGDWGGIALMAYFYREGLGSLPENNVLQPDLDKSVALIRKAVDAGQPWGFYDMGVAHEYGYGGAAYDKNVAWAYYLKAAELGSPHAQMTLAEAYQKAGFRQYAQLMLECAYAQEHGPAAYELGMKARVEKNYKEAILFFQNGTIFGNEECASTLYLLFGRGYWNKNQREERDELKELAIEADPERKKRYEEIVEALKINSDLKLTNLNKFLPLPPSELPAWHGIEDAFESEINDRSTY